MNSVRLNNLSLKYQRLTPFGCKDIGIRNFFTYFSGSQHQEEDISAGLRYEPPKQFIELILWCH